MVVCKKPYCEYTNQMVIKIHNKILDLLSHQYKVLWISFKKKNEMKIRVSKEPVNNQDFQQPGN